MPRYSSYPRDVDSTDYNDYLLADMQTGVDSGVGTDMNCNGSVTASEINVFVPHFEAGVPGPSGLDRAGSPMCP